MRQTNIFDYLYPSFKFNANKPIKIFEAFAGVGMQRLALKYSNINYESVGISEIDTNSLKSYYSLHGCTPNFGDIINISAKDLPPFDLLFYTFPCTDVSITGDRKGISSLTNSGLVLHVLRILNELKLLNQLPKVLIMENVINLVQSDFINDFNKIQWEIEKLGYCNYTKILDSKDFGIPQNRKRVFMVSVLGKYNYTFPDGIMLSKKINDYLENDVDRKYYLTEKMISYLTSTKNIKFPRRERFYQSLNVILQTGIANTITTREGSVAIGNFIFTNDKIRKITPRECWRLMGIIDDDFNKVLSCCCDSHLYKQAGNGVVVNVIAAIINQFFD